MIPYGRQWIDEADIQAVVDANPAGTTFTLDAGLYPAQAVTPRDGDVFQGAGRSTGSSDTLLLVRVTPLDDALPASRGR